MLWWQWLIIGIIAVMFILFIILVFIKTYKSHKRTADETGTKVDPLSVAEEAFSTILGGMSKAESLYNALKSVTGQKQSEAKLQEVLEKYKNYCTSNQLEYNEVLATKLIEAIVNFKNA